MMLQLVASIQERKVTAISGTTTKTEMWYLLFMSEWKHYFEVSQLGKLQHTIQDYIRLWNCFQRKHPVFRLTELQTALIYWCTPKREPFEYLEVHISLFFLIVFS